jgi:hypothetical protein
MATPGDSSTPSAASLAAIGWSLMRMKLLFAPVTLKLF